MKGSAFAGLVLAGCGGVQSLSFSSDIPNVANGSFETPRVSDGDFVEPGPASSQWSGDGLWGIARGSGPWGSGAHTGDQYGFLRSFAPESTTQSSMRRLATGFGGGSYRVTFWMARRGGSAPSGSVPVEVYAGSDRIMAATSPTNDFGWTRFTTDAFSPGGSTVPIEFRASSLPGDRATLIDDVSVIPA